MTISGKVDKLYSEKVQRDRAIEARAVLQNVRSVVTEANSRLQAIADSGSFDTLDNEVKQALIAGWKVAKDAQSTFEDVILAELLDWNQ